jgi:hypothetical protein
LSMQPTEKDLAKCAAIYVEQRHALAMPDTPSSFRSAVSHVLPPNLQYQLASVGLRLCVPKLHCSYMYTLQIATGCPSILCPPIVYCSHHNVSGHQ